MSRCRRGFKVIDLMVAILAIGVLLAVLPRVLVEGRDGCSRRVLCSNNIKVLALSLLNFSATHNHLPNAGTFDDDPDAHRGDPERSSIYRAIVGPGDPPGGAQSWLYSWVVEIMPYLDEPDIANAWDRTVPYWWPSSSASGQPANSILASTQLSFLRCPQDPTPHAFQGNLSYVVNGGFTRWPAVPVGWEGSSIDGQSGNGGVRRWAPAATPWRHRQEVVRQLGVMFLGTHTGKQPWDLKTTPSALFDGASHTLMVGENTRAGASSGNRYSRGVATNWACPLPNFSMFIASDDVCRTSNSADDCLGGQLTRRSRKADGPGWALANHRSSYEHINYGKSLTVEGSFPFAGSDHPGGANFAFCDGAVRFLSDTIDGTVYAKLITPAGSRLPEAIRQGPLGQDEFAQ